MSSFLPAATTKIPALDHLRALAITLVFVFHYRLFPHPDWVDTVGSFGWTGVDLFFVLSGYLIANQVFTDLKEGVFSLRGFFIKRAFRILPAYWVMLILYFFLPAFREWESLPPLWKFLTFTQNFGLDLRYQRTFSHAWSLCIEEQFYLIFPLAALAFSLLKPGKKTWMLIPLIIVAGVLIRIFCWVRFVTPALDSDLFGMTWYKWIYYPTFNRLDGILAGIGIAAFHVYFRNGWKRIAGYRNVILAIGFLLAVCAWFVCEDPYTFTASVFGFPLIALAFGCMVLAGTYPDSFLNKGFSKVTTSIATLSYSIYLTHKAAIHLAHMAGAHMGIETSGTLMFLLSIIFTLFAAILLRLCIELPCLKWKKIVQKRLQTQSSVS